ncbi:MAG: hypothetical protein HXY25_11670 [Alphaproteobacteria bacterium]|nr:hypothetical protein [Alphaproteobacteria bacterium]
MTDPSGDSFSIRINLVLLAAIVLLPVLLLGTFIFWEQPLKPRNAIISDLETQVAALKAEINDINEATAQERADFLSLKQEASTCATDLAAAREATDAAVANADQQMKAALAKAQRDLKAAEAETQRQSDRADANLERWKTCNDELSRR